MFRNSGCLISLSYCENIREPGLQVSSVQQSSAPEVIPSIPISLFTYTPPSFKLTLENWMELFSFDFSLESTLPHDLCAKRCEVITMRCSAWLGSTTYVGYQKATHYITSLQGGLKTARILLYALSDIHHTTIPPATYRTMETARCNLEALKSYLTCELTISNNLLDHWRTNSKGAVVMVLKDVSCHTTVVSVLITDAFLQKIAFIKALPQLITRPMHIANLETMQPAHFARFAPEAWLGEVEINAISMSWSRMAPANPFIVTTSFFVPTYLDKGNFDANMARVFKVSEFRVSVTNAKFSQRLISHMAGVFRRESLTGESISADSSRGPLVLGVY